MTDNATELTATERLRALLDERGVDWIADDSDVLLVTRWKTENSKPAMYVEPVGECCEGWNTDFSFYATPEQAIAATLGSETCSMEYGGDVTESTKRMLGVYFCSECGSPTYNDCMPYYCMYCGGKVVNA